MASYCQCGHVYGEHVEDGGSCVECECEEFDEIPYEELVRGYD